MENENKNINDITKNMSDVLMSAVGNLASEAGNILSAINKNIYAAITAGNDDEIYRWLWALNDYNNANKGEMCECEDIEDNDSI